MAGIDLSEGFVRLWRKAKYSDVFNDRDSDVWKVWTWCMMEANWKPRIKDGQEIMVGQLTTGRFQGAERLKLSPSKFYRCLKRLEKWKQISLKSNTQFTTITISNWIIYNPPIEESEHPNEQRMNTPLNTRMNTPKEGKESKEGKELNTSADKPPEVEQSESTPKQKKERERDLLFDAIAEVTASDPKASGSHIGRVKKHLLSAEPPYTPEEVRKWFDLLRSEGWIKGYPSLGFLEQTIGKVRAKPLPEAGKTYQQNGKQTHKQKMDDVWEAMKRKCQNAQS